MSEAQETRQMGLAKVTLPTNAAARREVYADYVARGFLSWGEADRIEARWRSSARPARRWRLVLASAWRGFRCGWNTRRI